MYSSIRCESFAKSTCYALCKDLTIVVKSGWKSFGDWVDPFADDRVASIALCSVRRDGVVCNEEKRECCDEVNNHYTYFALDLGPLYVRVGSHWYKTVQNMHFTIAYLPSLTSRYKTLMWITFRETLAEWIRFNCAYSERPYTLLQLRRVKVLDEYDNNCWTVRKLVDMHPDVINHELDNGRLELVTPTTVRDDAQGGRVFEPNRQAVVRMHGRDIGRLKQAHQLEGRNHGKEKSRHTVQMSFSAGQSEGGDFVHSAGRSKWFSYASHG